MMKNKVLFIVSDFYHGGAQREMYELDSTIDKTNTDITILCKSNLKKSPYFSDYFYKKHLALKTNIVFFSDIVSENNKKSLLKRGLNKLGITDSNEKKKKQLKTFLSMYDNVFFMGEYVYRPLASLLKLSYLDKITIFIMSGRFQGEQYRDLPKDNSYLFISGFDTKVQTDFEFEGFTDYKHIMLPLSLKIEKSHKKWTFSDKKIKKIGVFTRLSKAKPLDPFFYAYHLLLKELIDVELHVFGAGDYKEAGYDRYLNHLDLQNKVKFRGHQENIKETINNEGLDLIWFQGYLNKPAGYAGFDASLTGTPMLLWDFYNKDNPNINDLNYLYPHFKDLSLFVKASKTVLQDADLAKQISDRQFNDVVENRDINKNIKIIQHLLSSNEG